MHLNTGHKLESCILFVTTDVDECLEGALQSIDLCDHLPNSDCVNAIGAFVCACIPGFNRTDNGTCVSKLLPLFILICTL